MEIIAIATVFAFSVLLGLASTRVILEGIFRLMVRGIGARAVRAIVPQELSFSIAGTTAVRGPLQ